MLNEELQGHCFNPKKMSLEMVSELVNKVVALDEKHPKSGGALIREAPASLTLRRKKLKILVYQKVVFKIVKILTFLLSNSPQSWKRKKKKRSSKGACRKGSAEPPGKTSRRSKWF